MDILKKTEDVVLWLIEDDPLQHVPLSRALIRRGYQVRVITEASKAIKALSVGERPDIALLDINLEMDGAGYAVMSVYERANIPVIMMTSRETGHWDRQMSIHAGAVNFFAKPVSPDELHEAITTLRKLMQIKVTKQQVYDIWEGYQFDTQTGLITEMATGNTWTLGDNAGTLLEMVLDNPDKQVTEESIQEIIYRNADVNANQIVQFVWRVRQKLKGLPFTLKNKAAKYHRCCWRLVQISNDSGEDDGEDGGVENGG